MTPDAMFSVKDLSDLFGVTGQTIRQWSEEFVEYLSPRANPGKHRTRTYNEEDVEVFVLVAQMKEIGNVYEDIHVALASGQRGQLPDLSVIERKTRFEDRLLKLQTNYEKELTLANEKAASALARVGEYEQRLEKMQEEVEFWQQRAVEAQDKLSTMEEALGETKFELAKLQGASEGFGRERSQRDQNEQRYLAQIERLQTQVDSLLEERDKLSQELMGIYRKLATIQRPSTKADSQE